jgi:tetratricopeptide (TPR) repeat protein
MTTPSSEQMLRPADEAACSKASLRADLKAYLDRELPPLRRAVVGRHVRHCAICTAELADIARISDQLKDASVPMAMPADLRRRVLEKLNDPVIPGATPAPAAAERKRRRRTPLLLIGGGLAAACGAALFARMGPMMRERSSISAGTPAAGVEATADALSREGSDSLFRTGPVAIHLWAVDQQRTLAGSPPLPTLPLGPARSGRPVGVIVCEPVPTGGVGSADADFTAGCADWMNWSIGGIPELDRTPMLASICRGQWELHHTRDLRLSAAEARGLALKTGATHVAVGTVHRTGGVLTISYSLLNAGTGAVVVGPLVVSGDAMKIRDSLPQLCGQIATSLKVPVRNVPTAVELSPAELASLGRCTWSDRPLASDEQVLAAASHRSACGLMLSLIANDLSSESRTLQDADILLSRLAPTNSLAWSEVGYLNASALVPLAARLDNLRRTYPGNADLAAADVWKQSMSGTPDAQLRAAEDEVRDSPDNPDTWLGLGSVVSDDANELRSGRVAGDLSQAEWYYVGPAYHLWEQADDRATEIDPQHEDAWTRLALAATCAGDVSLASKAASTAESDSRDKARLVETELEIYQPKWGGNPAALGRVASDAVATEYGDTESAGDVAESLTSAGFDDMASQLLNRYLAASELDIARNPVDARAHWNRASALYSLDRELESIREYRIVARLLPNNIRAQSDFALQLDRHNDRGRAQAVYEHVLQLDPDNLRAAAQVGGLYHDQRRWRDAERLTRVVTQLYPNYAFDHWALGEDLQYQTPRRLADAEAEYRTAMTLGDHSPQLYTDLAFNLVDENKIAQAVSCAQEGYSRYKSLTDVRAVDLRSALAYAYQKAGRYTDAVPLAEEARGLRPDDLNANEILGDIYFSQGKRHIARLAWTIVIGHPSSDDPDGISHAKAMLAKYPENGT